MQWSFSKKLVAMSLLLAVIVVASGKSIDKVRRMPPGIDRMFARIDGIRPPKGYVSQSPRTVEGRFTAKVDHFNPQSRDTFEFSYLHNDQYYREGGPLFVVVGGRQPISPYFIENSHFRDVAAQQGAWLATFEHRYFGSSVPTENLSTENLRFLQTEQVLTDLIEWIDFLRREVMGDPNARVILNGVGYTGTLASWARQRFPNIIDGAWASSAPVRAAVSFPEFSQDVGNIIRTKGSDACYNRIFQAFNTIENLLNAGRVEMVSRMFNTCDPINVDDSLEVQLFFYDMMQSVNAGILQAISGYEGVGLVCGALAEFLNQTYSGVRECFDLSFENFVQYAIDEDIDAPQNREYGLRQTAYHDCTEFGHFPTADTPDQPFGNRVTYDLLLAECQAAFGDWLVRDVVHDGVRLTNFHFGATDPRTTNVLYTNGALDPFRHLSITSYQNLLSNARVTPGAFYGEDIFSISGYDSEELLETKHMAEQYISTWLGSPISPLRR
ncbi:putative serine protease K12H4.7 [Anopheles aquasalis]|uniref:putative serine protease K12H4.7 n=1 Tax=Anopheles aquasalis TaxID=42839 RepID=UPI00215A8C3B|nr:putative serine protease K12H4.7 [Anopheles aquasalis]